MYVVGYTTAMNFYQNVDDCSKEINGLAQLHSRSFNKCENAFKQTCRLCFACNIVLIFHFT